jgi:O-antigen/teichoic acid export membrane protein
MPLNSEETDSYLKKASKGAAIIFFGIIISSALGYLTRLVIVRFYGVEDYGLFSLGIAIVGIGVAISMFGMQTSVARFISYYLGRRETEKAKAVIFSSLRITFPVSIVVAVVVYFLSYQISFSFFNEPRLYQILWAFILMIPLSVVLINIIAGLRGFQRMKYKVYSEDLLKSISTLVLVVFLFGLGVIGILYAYIIGFILSIALAANLLRKSLPASTTKIRQIRFDRELLYFSLPLLLVAYTKMFMLWTDTILLGFFGTSFSVGLYNVALPTAGLLVIFLTSFRYIFIPLISEIYAKKDHENLKIIYRSMNKWLFLTMFPLFLLMMFFPDNILSILFGIEEISVNITFMILSLGFLIFSISGLSGDILLVRGKTKILFMTILISSSVNVIMNLALIPQFGIIGAAIATSSSFILLAILEIALCFRYSGLHPIQRSYIKPVVSGIISILIFYFLIKTLIINAQFYVLIIALPLYIIFYALLLLLMRGLDKNDILILKAIESKMGIRSRFLRRIIMKFF